MFYIHRATVEAINDGIDPVSVVEITEEYASMEQAIQYYIDHVNLRQEDRIKFFPEKPMELFDKYE